MPQIDFSNLDSTVHGPLRLGVLTALQVEGRLDFSTLKKRLGVSDGLLGAHLRTLEDAGYIASRKRFLGRRPQTTYRLTPAGRAALAEYLRTMQKLIDAVAAAAADRQI